MAIPRPEGNDKVYGYRNSYDKIETVSYDDLDSKIIDKAYGIPGLDAKGKIPGASLSENYGDVVNPYGSKGAYKFLAAPAADGEGKPEFRYITTNDLTQSGGAISPKALRAPYVHIGDGYYTDANIGSEYQPVYIKAEEKTLAEQNVTVGVFTACDPDTSKALEPQKVPFVETEPGVKARKDTIGVWIYDTADAPAEAKEGATVKPKWDPDFINRCISVAQALTYKGDVSSLEELKTKSTNGKIGWMFIAKQDIANIPTADDDASVDTAHNGDLAIIKGAMSSPRTGFYYSIIQSNLAVGIEKGQVTPVDSSVTKLAENNFIRATASGLKSDISLVTTWSATTSDENIPSEKLVEEGIKGAKSYADGLIAALDTEVTSTGGAKVTVKVTEENGKITAVNVAETDIASAATLGDSSSTAGDSSAFGTIKQEVIDRESAVAKCLKASYSDDKKTATIDSTLTSLKISTAILETSKGIKSTSDTEASRTVENDKLVLSGAITTEGGISAGKTIRGSKLYNAVWNDLTDCIEVDDDCTLEYGKCYCFDGSHYFESNKYAAKNIIGIHSDTAGFEMGQKNRKKELHCSVAGFVLAYVDKEYKVGTPLTCTKNGYLTKMKATDIVLHPERIVATFWKTESAEEWGDETSKIKVDGRKWVKIY